MNASQSISPLSSSATVALDPPDRPAGADRVVTILGVRVTDVTRPRACEILEAMIRQGDGRSRRVYFVNAHTLNLAAEDETYRAVLNAADCVFGDGTGVRWAARLRGIRVRDNVNGTDLVPEFLRATAGHGYRYYLLGGEESIVERAARNAAERFTGWTLVGCHHGYLNAGLDRRVVGHVNAARPDLLLVGQGNPIQERWIDEHSPELDVPVAMGVGGLFNFWSGAVPRAPLWMRRLGMEWVWVLAQQRHKARRYLVGNPKFLFRAARDAWFST